MPTDSTFSPLFGFGGLLESGKDTIADHLVEKFGFVKVNMSDPIDKALRILNPIVTVELASRSWLDRLLDGVCNRDPQLIIKRYEDVRAELGFTKAKTIPEFRALMQRFGVEVGRKLIDNNIWVNFAERTIQEHRDAGRGVCVSGIRFGDEQHLIARLGGTLVWVYRPGHLPAKTATSNHSSEVSLSADDFDTTVVNDGSVADLERRAERQLLGAAVPA